VEEKDMLCKTRGCVNKINQFLDLNIKQLGMGLDVCSRSLVVTNDIESFEEKLNSEYESLTFEYTYNNKRLEELQEEQNLIDYRITLLLKNERDYNHELEILKDSESLNSGSNNGTDLIAELHNNIENIKKDIYL